MCSESCFLFSKNKFYLIAKLLICRSYDMRCNVKCFIYTNSQCIYVIKLNVTQPEMSFYFQIYTRYADVYFYSNYESNDGTEYNFIL